MFKRGGLTPKALMPFYKGKKQMTQIGIREMLEAGAHFGHQTRRWNYTTE